MVVHAAVLADHRAVILGRLAVRSYIFLIAALAMFASPSSAQQNKPSPILPYKNLGAWNIQVDLSAQRGCLIFSTAPGPNLRIGYSSKRTMFIWLEGDGWQRSLEAGKQYAMTIRIDDRDHPGTMDARRLDDGYIVLERYFDDAIAARQFLEDFQRGNRLSVHYQSRQLVTYRLVSSALAGEELLRCQAVQDRDRPQPAAAPTAPGDDPIRKEPAPATGPFTPGGAAPTAMPALTQAQHVDVVRLAANLLARMPGFRILNDDETKALDPRLVSMGAAVVWRTEGATGLLHLFPGSTAANVPRLAARIAGGMVQQCTSKESTSTVAPDVRADDVRRMHIACFDGNSGLDIRLILMPGSSGVYYFATVSELKDRAAGARADEALRNALFEVVRK